MNQNLFYFLNILKLAYITKACSTIFMIVYCVWKNQKYWSNWSKFVVQCILRIRTYTSFVFKYSSINFWEKIYKCFLVFCISFVNFFHENKYNMFEFQFCYFILVFALKIFFFYLSIESFNHIIVNFSIIAIIATPI